MYASFEITVAPDNFAKNAGRIRDSFGLNSSRMQDFYGTMSDNKSKLVSTDVTGGYDISGQNSMVASVFDRPVYLRPGNRMSANTLAYTGGEYKVGGVYDMPASEMDRLLAQGAEIEIIE